MSIRNKLRIKILWVANNELFIVDNNNRRYFYVLLILSNIFKANINFSFGDTFILKFFAIIKTNNLNSQ